MMSKHAVAMIGAGILGALLVVGCSGQEGAGTPSEAVGLQSAAVTTPIPGPTGYYSGCTSVYECKATSGYPSLVIDCPETVTFSGPGSGAQTGTHFEVWATNITPTWPVLVDVSGATAHHSCGMNLTCEDAPYPTYLAGATNTYCGTPSGGGGKCKAPLQDCGDGICVRHCT